MTNHEKIDFIILNGTEYTIEQLMVALDLTHNQLYVICKNHGIRPKDSNWCSKTVNGIPPLDPGGKKKIERVKGEYSNKSPYGIADELKD